MNFNADSSKQAQEVTFSRKVNRTLHFPLAFNNSNVTQTYRQMYLRMMGYYRFYLNSHLENLFGKKVWKYWSNT